MRKLHGKVRITNILMKDIAEIRADFPILKRKVYGKPLVYFDNGATTQKPQSVLDAVNEVYESYNGNIHRGVHFLSDMSSEAYEAAREKVRSFVNAEKREEIIFTSGTTGSINGIAFSFGEAFIKPGDGNNTHLSRTPCKHCSMADDVRKERGTTSCNSNK